MKPGAAFFCANLSRWLPIAAFATACGADRGIAEPDASAIDAGLIDAGETPDAWSPDAAPPTTFACPAYGPSSVSLTSITPGIVVPGDFDCDGVLDAVVADPWRAGSAVQIHRGLGGGELPAWRVVAIDDRPIAVVVGDFDDDGHDDLVVATSLAHAVRQLVLVRSRCALGPAAPANIVVSDTLIRPEVATADVDGDGADDLVLLERADPSSLVVLYGGPAPFTRRDTVVTSARYLDGMGAADIDGDGDTDLFGWSDFPTGGGVYPILNAAPGWVEAATLATRVYGVAASDLDGDGAAELVVHVPDSDAPPYHRVVLVHWVAQEERLFEHSQLALDSLPTLVDVDIDGRPDLVLGTSWLRNVGNLAFAPAATLAAAGGFDDFTGDGRPDIHAHPAEGGVGGTGALEVFANRLERTCGVVPTCATAAWQEAVLDTGPEQAREVLVGDVVGSDAADVVVLTEHGVGVLRQLGAAGFASLLLVPVAAPRDAALVDLDGDGRDEVIVVGGTPAWTVVDLDEAQASRSVTWPGFPAATHVLAAEVTGDGATDLVFSDATSVVVVPGPRFDAWLALGATPLETASFVGLYAGDLNRDGAAELLIPWVSGGYPRGTCIVDAPVTAGRPCTRTGAFFGDGDVVDLDADGDADVLAPLSAIRFGVIASDGAGNLIWPGDSVAPPFGWWTVRSGHVVGAARDVVVALKGGGLAIYRGGAVVERVDTSVPFRAMTVADLDGDHADEVIIGGSVGDGGRVSVLRRCP